MKYYQNKTVLITGAFGGFGRHFINQLLNEGADLILSDLAAAPLSEILSHPELENRIKAVIPADLSTYEGCLHLYEEIGKRGITPDIIVHNAGIAFLGNYLDVPLEGNEKIVNINLLSIMRLNNLFVPDMVKRKTGHLIYVSSVAGFVATPLGVAYSASKFGLRAFAMALHGEIKKFGVKSSIVYPFWSKTPIMKSQRYGDPKLRTMPDYYAADPDKVVAKTLRGAARGRMHIHPCIFSWAMWQAIRFVPVIAEQRTMRDKLLEE